MTESLKQIFKNYFKEEVETVTALRAHASERQIYRLIGKTQRAVGVIHKVRQENRAFIEFTNHFLSFGLNVPRIYGEDAAAGAYLQEDLGDTTLYDSYRAERGSLDQPFPAKLEALYEQAITDLPRFQIVAGKTLNFSFCYPARGYDRAAMIWDMHYFRDSFLYRLKIPFDADKLEADFQKFADFLSSAESSFFLYRDFQSRNIMVHNDKLYYIDYQSGREGALYYDLATILYQSKAPLPEQVRTRLLTRYLDQAARYIEIDPQQFSRFFKAFVLIQLMHRFGTYGRQGLEYGKSYFLESIPPAIDNLKELLNEIDFSMPLSTLKSVCEQVVAKRDTILEGNAIKKNSENTTLTINIVSFSYKQGLPKVESAHGGGFVFDCRCILNPGREPEYKQQSGLDQPVKEYINRLDGARRFKESSFALIDQAIESYLARGFTELNVGFGCTGGQHRSVYFTEMLAAHLQDRNRLAVSVQHRDLERSLIAAGKTS